MLDISVKSLKLMLTVASFLAWSELNRAGKQVLPPSKPPGNPSKAYARLSPRGRRRPRTVAQGMRRGENTRRRPKQPEEQVAKALESLVLHKYLQGFLQVFLNPAKVWARRVLEGGADLGPEAAQTARL